MYRGTGFRFGGLKAGGLASRVDVQRWREDGGCLLMGFDFGLFEVQPTRGRVKWSGADGIES